MQQGWLKVVKVEDLSLVQVLRQSLDWGEAEAVALALQTKVLWTLLDERDARRVAKGLKLKVTGVLGILLRGRREGKLPSVSEALRRLRSEAGFRISDRLFAELLKEAGESG